ncbi:MAG: ABC transporter permease [Muribaculaceae bacterium]
MFKKSFILGCRQLCTRKIFIFAMIVVPVMMCVFFITLLQEGLPVRVPTAVVDLDHSQMSRSLIRNLKAQQLVDVTTEVESYDKAMEAMRRTDVYGFYVIPANFQRDALAGQTPTLNYYSNMAYFIPGTFSYKGYKSVAVVTAAALVKDAAGSKGVSERTVNALVQPVAIDVNAINNPWPNYSLYMTPSFVAGTLELMIVLITIMTITYEVKLNTAHRWLQTAGGSMVTALTGKLLPQTLIWLIVAWCCQALMYSWGGFVLHCPLWQAMFIMALFVVACQGIGVFIAGLVPNPRFALSVGALVMMLGFSVTGISFPVEKMYGAIGIFSYIYPMRWFFLAHVSQALNGLPLYYSRVAIAVMALMPFLGFLVLPRLKKAMQRCIYVP